MNVTFKNTQGTRKRKSCGILANTPPHPRALLLLLMLSWQLLLLLPRCCRLYFTMATKRSAAARDELLYAETITPSIAARVYKKACAKKEERDKELCLVRVKATLAKICKNVADGHVESACNADVPDAVRILCMERDELHRQGWDVSDVRSYEGDDDTCRSFTVSWDSAEAELEASE